VLNSAHQRDLNNDQFLASLLFFAALLPASAQLAGVEGIAVNGASGEPTAGANIRPCEQPASKNIVGRCAAAFSYEHITRKMRWHQAVQQ
jgi:hypothetical protein